MATREIRARTGQLEDPLPEGKKLAEKEFPKITPAKHDGADNPELSKDDILAHKEELKHMQHKDAKHGGDPNSVLKNDGTTKHISTGMSGREPRGY